MYRLSFLLLFASGLQAQIEKDGACNLANNAVQNLDVTKIQITCCTGEGKYREETDIDPSIVPLLEDESPLAYAGQVQVGRLHTPQRIFFFRELQDVQMFGTWHQIARIPNQNETGDCNVLTLNGTYENDELVVTFSMSEIVEKKTTERRGYIVSTPALGVYTLRFNDSSEILLTITATDYDSQAILYSCAAISENKKLVWAWQYHRNATITSDQMAVLNWIAGLNSDLKNVAWKNTQEASVCGNKGIYLTPGFLVVLMVGSLTSLLNSPKYLSSFNF